MAIFHSYVSLPEGIFNLISQISQQERFLRRLHEERCGANRLANRDPEAMLHVNPECPAEPIFRGRGISKHNECQMPTIELGRYNLLYQEKSPWIYLNCLFAQVGLSRLDPQASITIDFTEEMVSANVIASTGNSEEPARTQRVQHP